MARQDPTYAGFGKRSLALLLDWLLLSIITTTVALLMQRWEWLIEGGNWTVAKYRYAGYFIQGAVLVFILYCWVRLQGTPGKLLMGCRIVDAKTGMAPGLGKSIIRLLGYLVSALPLGLGFLWILLDSRGQGWHDKLAGTYVVIDDESQKQLQQLAQELR